VTDETVEIPPSSGYDAVRTDGGLVHIRPAVPADEAALIALDHRASDRSIYYRFFAVSRHAADTYVERLLRPSGADHRALVALIGGDIVGVASFERLTDTSAEIAVLIDDQAQHKGIGTLLIEHLADMARQCGVTRFVADVLAANTAMIDVIRQLGFAVASRTEDGTVHVTLELDQSPTLLEAIDNRDRAADVASMHPLLYPRSVAVIGAGNRPRSVGHEVLRNILDGGFTGTVHVVNPHRDAVLGVASVPSARDLPTAPDLAIIAVPAGQVPDVVLACGKRGARGIVLLTAGFGELGEAGESQQRVVLTAARQYSMRLIGPNCLGLVNPDPTVRLNATFAPVTLRPGGLGLVSQSGALGIAVLAAAGRRGLGLSQFVSVGNKADVSGNDLLLAWERDERTKVIALYLESFGNPRKFARIARRVSGTKPIIAIKSGRSAAGQRAGRSHTAAAASADTVVDALFRHAGVLRVDTMEQMLDVAQLLTDQPLPDGPRVAIIGNSGGPEILAADAADAAGLAIVDLPELTRERLQEAVPTVASTQNPVDLGAAAQPADVAAALRILLDTAEVDAVITVITETSVADLDEIIDAISETAEGKPVIAVHVGGATRSLRRLPVYAFPEPAAKALGLAWRYATIRKRETPVVTPVPAIDVDGAATLILDQLATGASWLGPSDTARLLVRYGIPMCPQRIVPDVDGAIAAAAELGYPLAVKLARGPVHKTGAHAVVLNIENETALRSAVIAVQSVALRERDVLIQPMVNPGTELIVGALQDPQFGPVVMVGAGGVLADMIADRQLRLAPLGTEDADDMVSRLRTAPLLDGYRGREVISRSAIRELLVRVARLIDDLPQVAELDLNPVICSGGDDMIVVDAKVRIATPPRMPDAIARQLRT
jgi:acyl-CoA synthetase (NDP forming)/RimJ/RimL family protein N-acetyltransferase